MVGTVTPLKAVTPVSDIETDIENTMNARERVHALIALVETKRRSDQVAFLQTFAKDLAAVQGDPDKTFVDAEYTKFTAWKSADDDTVKRLEALRLIAHGLEVRIREFAVTNLAAVVAYLTVEIDAINTQIAADKSEAGALTERKRKLEDELDDLTSGAAAASSVPGTAAAAPAKKAAGKRKAAKKL
ncbi:MAG TPA: hypothetical protein VMN56_02515 [Casimicrobiaceae bacterium]|nr:hypothetical protein [Casimicrobiaceae bacterium]